jgi:hypothetical protein
VGNQESYRASYGFLAPGTEGALRIPLRTLPDGKATPARHTVAVQHQEADSLEGTATTSWTTEERGGPGLRDAEAIVARVNDDEAAAAAARRSADAGLPLVEPDATIGPELRDGERVHALRDGALMNRLDGGPMPGYAGRLYLTDRRIIHAGQALFSLALTTLDEVSIVGERLLLTLTSGEGVSFDVTQPHLLRAQIGIARTAHRE